MIYCVFYTPAPVIYFDNYTNEELYLFTIYTETVHLLKMIY